MWLSKLVTPMISRTHASMAGSSIFHLPSSLLSSIFLRILPSRILTRRLGFLYNESFGDTYISWRWNINIHALSWHQCLCPERLLVSCNHFSKMEFGAEPFQNTYETSVVTFPTAAADDKCPGPTCPVLYIWENDNDNDKVNDHNDICQYSADSDLAIDDILNQTCTGVKNGTSSAPTTRQTDHRPTRWFSDLDSYL